MRDYYVYIMTNRSGTLYTGITNDLKRRVHEHGEKLLKGGYPGSGAVARGPDPSPASGGLGVTKPHIVIAPKMPREAARVRTRSRVASLTPTWAEGRPAVGLSPLSPLQAGRGEGGEGVSPVSKLPPSAQSSRFLWRRWQPAWGTHTSCQG